MNLYCTQWYSLWKRRMLWIANWTCHAYERSGNVNCVTVSKLIVSNSILEFRGSAVKSTEDEAPMLYVHGTSLMVDLSITGGNTRLCWRESLCIDRSKIVMNSPDMWKPNVIGSDKWYRWRRSGSCTTGMLRYSGVEFETAAVASAW